MYAIKTEKLTKKYKEKTAVSNLDLKINEGEMYGLLGVNGAGKTTTMKRLSAESAVHCSQTFRHGFQTFGSILKWSAVGSKTLQTHFRLPCRKRRKGCNFGQLFGHYARTYPRLRICGCVACSGCGRLFRYDEKE